MLQKKIIEDITIPGTLLNKLGESDLTHLLLKTRWCKSCNDQSEMMDVYEPNLQRRYSDLKILRVNLTSHPEILSDLEVIKDRGNLCSTGPSMPVNVLYRRGREAYCEVGNAWDRDEMFDRLDEIAKKPCNRWSWCWIKRQFGAY